MYLCTNKHILLILYIVSLIAYYTGSAIAKICAQYPMYCSPPRPSAMATLESLYSDTTAASSSTPNSGDSSGGQNDPSFYTASADTMNAPYYLGEETFPFLPYTDPIFYPSSASSQTDQTCYRGNEEVNYPGQFTDFDSSPITSILPNFAELPGSGMQLNKKRT